MRKLRAWARALRASLYLPLVRTHVSMSPPAPKVSIATTTTTAGTLPCCTNTHLRYACVWVGASITHAYASPFGLCTSLPPSLIYSLSVACCLLCTACTCIYICVCVCDKNFSCCILAFKVLPLLLRGRGLLFPFPSLCQISFAWLGHTFPRQMLCVCVWCACVLRVWFELPKRRQARVNFPGFSPSCKIEIVIFVFGLLSFLNAVFVIVVVESLSLRANKTGNNNKKTTTTTTTNPKNVCPVRAHRLELLSCCCCCCCWCCGCCCCFCWLFL